MTKNVGPDSLGAKESYLEIFNDFKPSRTQCLGHFPVNSSAPRFSFGGTMNLAALKIYVR